MSKAGEASTGTAIPLNVTWNPNTQSYSMSPRNPDIAKGGTAQLNATNRAFTIRFNPTTTPFGASQDVGTGSPKNIDVGDSDYLVGYCLTTTGGQCTAPSPSRLTEDTTGTIKVGSGMGGH